MVEELTIVPALNRWRQTNKVEMNEGIKRIVRQVVKDMGDILIGIRLSKLTIIESIIAHHPEAMCAWGGGEPGYLTLEWSQTRMEPSRKPLSSL